ncbi:MAG: hypothetical protein ACPGYT_02880, partial [Nitrospirales bacterium]
MTKLFSVFVTLVVALNYVTPHAWAQCPENDPGIAINNGINGDGFWEVCVGAGGGTQTGKIDPPGPTTTTDLIFDYGHFVEVGHNNQAIRLTSASTSSLTEDTVFVNFQPSHATVPVGYQKDSGSLYTTTRGYGWTQTVHTRERQ